MITSMPIAEIFTAINLVNACVSGLIGNRLDGSVVAAASRCAGLLAGRGLPQNHHVLAAMHASFVDALDVMVRACDSAGGEPADNFSRQALGDFAKSKALKTLSLDAANLPLDRLEASVREIYDHPGRTAGESGLR